ncbi:outer membrane beta-barrel protein [Algibacter sp. L4_22]|uniref:outer membrane beta-barrel protein n=1 Tax=Algibacter sp. L4_22 TaxID=2942477 RepID=UPI00201B4685|nr:outer membrane beta-barrel protein [Algibacter sp. L4_22]MCL5126839.1 outer membrane beta-barrel protein [Algibacter sp. L4_22]
MVPILKFNKHKLIAISLICFATLCFSQSDTSTFKAQFALGVNSPSSNGFVSNFEANSVNFPTINLGLQYMFNSLVGAKLDLGYNRFSNAKNTPEFKTNYTRINAQLVYNASNLLGLYNNFVTFLHAGPGISIIKPLGDYGENKTTFLNAMAGVEFHYGVSDKLSLYLDTSYILGFGKIFNPINEGFGSFNGNLLTITVGASISLSGCKYCGQ